MVSPGQNSLSTMAIAVSPSMIRTRLALLLAACLLSFLAGCKQRVIAPPPEGRVIRIEPGPEVQDQTQEALIKAQPGDTIQFAAGTFDFTRGLSLTVKNVTLRGMGMDKTFLSFKNQNAGSEGLLVTAGDFVIEDLSIDDAKGDGIKVNGVENVTFRRIQARWTGGQKDTNGAYGIYPVSCKYVMIDGCHASGASDAGIYVGQSQNIIVKGCHAEKNVAGIEIENSTDADVYQNTATNNTGGLLVFDLPGLPVKNGKRVHVRDNKIYANNHENFGVKGSLVASIPQGLGMMVMAADDVEVEKNDFADNDTCNLIVASYLITRRPIKEQDKDYDPISEGVYIHHNTFNGGGKKPAGEFGQLFGILLGNPVPDILYDGIVNPAKLVEGKLPTELRLTLQDNRQKDGPATFANLKLGELGDIDPSKKLQALSKLTLHKPKVERDPKAFEGKLKSLPPVSLGGGS